MLLGQIDGLTDPGTHRPRHPAQVAVRKPVGCQIPVSLAIEKPSKNRGQRRCGNLEAIDHVKRTAIEPTQSLHHLVRKTNFIEPKQDFGQHDAFGTGGQGDRRVARAEPGIQDHALVACDPTQHLQTAQCATRTAHLCAPQHRSGEARGKRTGLGHFQPGLAVSHRCFVVPSQDDRTDSRDASARPDADPCPFGHAGRRAAGKVQNGNCSHALDGLSKRCSLTRKYAEKRALWHVASAKSGAP